MKYSANWHEKVEVNPNRWFFQSPQYEMRRFTEVFNTYREAESYLYRLVNEGRDIFLATIIEEEETYSCFL